MNIYFWIATLGGIGHLPLSNFIATMIGILWMYLWQKKTKYWLWILAIQIVLGIIFITLAPSQETADPSVFVVDEFVVAGALLLVSRQWLYLLYGLAIFTVLDITKPLARYFENLPGGFAIVGDDLISVILAATILLLLRVLIEWYKTHSKNEK